jgi:hypothetical protein
MQPRKPSVTRDQPAGQVAVNREPIQKACQCAWVTTGRPAEVSQTGVSRILGTAPLSRRKQRQSVPDSAGRRLLA